MVEARSRDLAESVSGWKETLQRVVCGVLPFDGIKEYVHYSMGFPGGSVVKNLPAEQETCSISVLGRSPGEGNGNPHQYSYWEIPWAEEPGGLQFMGFQKVRNH